MRTYIAHDIAHAGDVMPKPFTEQGVAKLKYPDKPKRKDSYQHLQKGVTLCLRVSYAKSKTWFAITYRRGKNGKLVPTRKKLGVFPEMGVAAARKAANAHFNDPNRTASKAEVATFREVAEDFIHRHVDKKGLRSKLEIVRCLRKYVYDSWESRPFNEIGRKDVNLLLDHIVDHHGPRQADVVLGILSTMMRWYQSREDVGAYMPPISGVRKRQPYVERERILSHEEIRALWKACGETGTFGAVVKMLLLTAQRRGKVAAMRWDDIKDGEWVIPAEPGEKSNAGTLKLPKMVLDIIDQQPRLVGNQYVFAGHRKGQPINAFSQGKAELTAKLPVDMPHWQLHDLRRTARSLMSEADVRPDIAERVLGHAIPGVWGTYDRHKYPAQKAQALEALASKVDAILNPRDDNVIDLHARA